VLKARLVSALETKYDEPHSKVTFNFNLRRYTKAGAEMLVMAYGQGRTLVHVRAQLEQLQDTFMSKVGLYDGHKSSS